MTARRLRGLGHHVAVALLIVFFGSRAALAQTSSNDPRSCAELWQEIGFPSIDEGADVDFVVVCHAGYVLAHNSRTKTPDWVIEHLTRTIAEGNETRPNVKFRQEPALPLSAPGAVDDDYKNSDFDRGHQAPSADFKSSAELMTDTFVLSNVVPQEGPGFNRTIWRDLEDLVRKVALRRGELYVITGPVYQKTEAVHVSADADRCGNAIDLKPLRKKVIGASNVAVPAALFKLVYDPQLGRLNGYLLQNVNHRALQGRKHDADYLAEHRVSLHTIEELTGWRFFTALEDEEGGSLTEGCAATMRH